MSATLDTVGGDVMALLRAVVRHELAMRGDTAIAIVDEVRYKAGDADPGNYDCTIRLRGREAVYTHVPLCTPHLGSAAPPEVGDLVVVAFVGGDDQAPVVVGRLYGDAVRVPDIAAGEAVFRLPVSAGEDQRIEVRCASDGERSVRVDVDGGTVVTLTAGGVRIESGDVVVHLDGENKTVTCDNGAASVTLADDGSIALAGDGDVNIKAKGTIALKAQGDLQLEATGNASLRGAKVDIN